MPGPEQLPVEQSQRGGGPPGVGSWDALPERAPDDADVGWGERLADPEEDDRRYLEDRPPHWGSD